MTTENENRLPPFNGLSHAEAERLALLAEECGEVIQAVGKILRHGYESQNPTHQDGMTNRHALEREVSDVSVAIAMMVAARDVDSASMEQRRLEKWVSIRKYLHHQVTL